MVCVRHEALDCRGRCKTFPSGRRSGAMEAEGSLIRGTPGRAESSPDKAGTRRHHQTFRVRQARSEGVTEVNQWLKPRKRSAGSNLVDTGRFAARNPGQLTRANSEAEYTRRWGGHAECLRRRCGDAVGVELSAQPDQSRSSERGNLPWLPYPSGTQPGGGQARCRPMAMEWDGGSVVVRARERRAHGEGSQQVGREETGMPGGRR